MGTLDGVLSLSSKGESGYNHINDDRRTNTASFLGEMPVGTLGELKFRADYSEGKYDTQGGGLAVPEAAQTREARISEGYQTLQWHQRVGREGELIATLSHSKLDYRDKGYTSDRFIPGVILGIEFGIDEERYEADVQYSHHFSDQWRMVTGIGYYYEQTHSPFYFDTESWQENDLYRLFSHGEYRLRKDLVLNAGAMLEHSKISNKWLFLPRFAIHYHLNDRHTVRAMYSTGSRQPAPYENQSKAIVRGFNQPITLYRVIATGVDRGGLDPEFSQSYELRYHWQPSRYTNLDVRLFQVEVSDLIGGFFRFEPERPTVLPGNFVFDFGNDEDITIHGFEAQLDWQVQKGTRIFTSYALTDIDAGGTRFNAGYEKTVPQHSFGLLLSQSFGKGWQASINYDYQSAMAWYLDDHINDYHKLDARIAKSLKLGNARAVAELIGTNLLGPVSDYLPGQEWDQSVFLRLSVEY